MIDTVKFQQPRSHRENVSRRNWVVQTVMRETVDPDGFEDERLAHQRGCHKTDGIKFFGNRDQIVLVEASLPRVLFGSNGKLLKSQSNINAALRKLDRMLGKISHRSENARAFKRVDLVWHVPGSCSEFILAHQNVAHPRVRKATCTYDKQSITWNGSALRLMLYDKSQKEIQKKGSFVRVEAQLRGHVLDEYLDKSFGELDFAVAYRFLRRLVLQLEPAVTPVVSGMVSLLANCSRLPAPSGQVHPVEAYLQGLTKRRRTTLRSEIRSHSYESRVVRWAELLPETPPECPPELELPAGYS